MDFEKIWQEAQEAGKQAAERTAVKGMIVQEADLFGDRLPDGKAWYVADGVCGFAWLNIRPASRVGRNDCDLVKWLRQHRIGYYDDYTKAWSVSIHEYNQCMQRKEAHADAMAAVLEKYGIRVVVQSRLD